MLTVGTIGFRFIELGFLGLLLVTTGLLYLKRRPAGLVWVSALLVGTLAAHLFLEEGRWQLVPAYLLAIVEAFWLARPAGMPYRSARRYGPIGALARVVVTVLVVAAVALPIAVPLFVVASPGPVGTATIYQATGTDGTDTDAREADAGESGAVAARVPVRIWYPTAAGPTGDYSRIVAPFWSARELGTNRLPGFPRFMAEHLTLVPTPAVLRAPVSGEHLPLLVIVDGPDALPGDYLNVVLEAASHGWVVVRGSRSESDQQIVDLIAYLSDEQHDRALEHLIDPRRVLIFRGPGAPQGDLGLPSVSVTAQGTVDLSLSASRFELVWTNAVIPPQAFTTRYLLVRPWRFFVGSSDVSPALLDRALRKLVDVVLADGSFDSPVFGGSSIDQQALSDGLAGAVIRPRPDARR